MPDEIKQLDEEKTEQEETQKVEINAQVGDVFYRFDTGLLKFRAYEVVYTDSSGNFTLAEEGKIAGIVIIENEKQIAAFLKDYRKDKESVKKEALELIDERISGLGELRAKIKNG